MSISKAFTLAALFIPLATTFSVAVQPELSAEDPVAGSSDEPLIDVVQRAVADEKWLDAAQAFHEAWTTLVRDEDEIGVRLVDVPQPNGPSAEETGGLRSRLRTLFRAAPDAFRVEYQQQFDSGAAAALKKSLNDRRFDQLDVFLREYEHCDSAQAGLRVLAKRNIQQGNFFDAALSLRKLDRTMDGNDVSVRLLLAECWARGGLSMEAQQTVRQLADQIGYGRSVEGNEPPIRLPDDPTVIADWIASRWPSSEDNSSDWTMPAGDAHRVRSQPAVTPGLVSQWNQPLFQSHVHSQFNESLQTIGDSLIPIWMHIPLGPSEPVVVGDHVIYTAAGSLQAVHRNTGRLLWESSLFNRQLNAVLDPQDESRERLDTIASQILLDSGRNHVRGQLTTDGRTVYAVEETSQGIDPFLAGTVLPAVSNQQYSILRAYDVVTGRLKAQAGGAALQVDPQKRDPLMGVYFLGAPLLLNEQIYVLIEDAQGINLLEVRLPPASSVSKAEQQFEIVRRQLLSTPEWNRSDDPVRRYAGITPSFADGMILCQGCDASVVAVDATDLSIEWRHHYRSNVVVPDLGNQLPLVGGATTAGESRRYDTLRRPHDCLIRVSGDSLLLMPRDSNQVICLDVNTGRGRWAQPRGRIRYFGAITDDVVVLAGGTEVRALRLADGSTIWSQVLDNDVVSGQPASTARLTQLPTFEGRIISIDNTTGRRLLCEFVSDDPVGNLLSLQDGVLIRTHTQLEFRQGDEVPAEQSLAAIRQQLLTQDPASLIPQLEAFANDDGSDPELQRTAGRLLADQLLEALRIDYNGNRHHIPRLRELTRDQSLTAEQVSDVISHTLGVTTMKIDRLRSIFGDFNSARLQQDRLERSIVEGLLQQIDRPPAELAEQIAQKVRNVLQHPAREMRQDRVQAMSSAIMAGAIARTLRQLDDDRRQQVIDVLTPSVAEVWGTPDTGLRRFEQMRFFWMAGLGECLVGLDVLPSMKTSGNLPGIDALATLQLLASGESGLVTSDTSWKKVREFWSTAFGEPKDPNVGDWLSLDRIRQNSSTVRNDAAGHLVDVARRRLHRLDTTDDLADSPKVTASPARDGVPGRNPLLGAPENLIPIYGSPGAFRGWKVMTLHGDSQIIAVDDRGAKQWAFDTNPNPGRAIIRARRLQGNSKDYAVACGFLLALRYQQSLFMLDCSQIKDGRPRLLWSLPPGRLLAPPSGVQSYIRGWERTTIYDRQFDGLAPVGPMTAWGLPLYQGRRLTVVDPWTGISRWAVDDLPEDCRLLADRDTLCIVSASEGLIQVRDLRDGFLRQAGALPMWWKDANELYDSSVRHLEIEAGIQFPWRVAIDGTRCVVFRLGHDEAELAAHDMANPSADCPATWKVSLSSNSVYSNVADGTVAVLSNDSTLRLIRLNDGRELAAHTVARAPDCDRLYLRKSHGQLIVLTHCDDHSQEDAPVISQSVAVNGPIYAVSADDLSMVWTGNTSHEFLRIVDPERAPIPDVAPLLVLLKATIDRRGQNQLIVQQLAARVLDVRSGHVVYEEADLGRNLSYHGIQFSGDRRFTLVFNRRDVEFDFSGDATK